MRAVNFISRTSEFVFDIQKITKTQRKTAFAHSICTSANDCSEQRNELANNIEKKFFFLRIKFSHQVNCRIFHSRKTQIFSSCSSDCNKKKSLFIFRSIERVRSLALHMKSFVFFLCFHLKQKNTSETLDFLVLSWSNGRWLFTVSSELFLYFYFPLIYRCTYLFSDGNFIQFYWFRVFWHLNDAMFAIHSEFNVQRNQFFARVVGFLLKTPDDINEKRENVNTFLPNFSCVNFFQTR